MSSSIISATPAYVANGLGASQDSLAVQKTYASIVQQAYNSLVLQIDTYGDSLLAGESIGNFNISDLFRNGAWARPVVVSNISTLEQSLRTEIFSRSINALWKVRTSNKMWLTFVSLPGNSTISCENDQSGPQDMKWCQVENAMWN